MTTVSTSAEEEHEYLLAALGPDRAEYLRRFERFEKPRALPIAWNWKVFLFSLGWLVGRRMYGYALLYYAAAVIFYYSLWPMYENCALRETASDIRLFYILATFIALPMFADRLYFGYLRRRINRIKSATPDRKIRLRLLATLGWNDDPAITGSKPGFIARVKDTVKKWPVIVAGIVPLVICLHAMPNNADYSDRAKFSEVMLFAGYFKQTIAEFYSTHRRLPQSLEEAGIQFNNSNSRFVKNVVLDKRTGAIKATTTGICPLEGRTLLLMPIPSNDRITWKCGLDDASGKSFSIVPAECRNYIELAP